MATLQVGLANHNPKISRDELIKVAAALQVQVKRDLAPIWDVDADVVALEDPRLIPRGVSPIIIVEAIPQDIAGLHQIEMGVPWAMVSTKRDWHLAASHELIEMLVDPTGEQTVRSRGIEVVDGQLRDTDDAFDYVLEACDPIEDSDHAYRIDGIMVSDFFTPQYFDAEFTPETKYSHNGALTRPREVRPNGYLSWRDPQGGGLRQLRNFGGLQIVDLPQGGPEPGQSTRQFVDHHTKTPRTHPHLFGKA